MEESALMEEEGREWMHGREERSRQIIGSQRSAINMRGAASTYTDSASTGKLYIP